jgi:hemolysin activation/secretion protein
MKKTTIVRYTVLATSLLCSALASHATPPDAGQLLRQENEHDKPPAPSLPAPVLAPEKEPLPAEAGPQVVVNGFKVVGLQALSEAQAQAILAPYVGQSLGMNNLHSVAERFEKWLRTRGLFTARAYIPPQDVQGGVIELRVLEGRLEGIDVKSAPGTRLLSETLRAILTGALPAGAAMEQAQLERGLLLMNDLPATSARAVLVPGKELGGSRVLVEAAQGPVLSGSAELDNTGNRYTGEWRAGATLLVNDAYGRGDQWSLRVAATQGTSFARVGYSALLANNGLKGGVSLLDSRYKLCCNLDTNTPEADGEANAVAAYVSYPYVRTLQQSVSMSANIAMRKFINRGNGIVISDKSTSSLMLALSGDQYNTTGMTGFGSYTTYGVQWTTGSLNLDGAANDRLADSVTQQSHGQYNKLNMQASHMLRLNPTTTMYGSVSGQWAGKNLDSSEKFVLGGPNGVRAYPAGEGSGDEGWLASVEWRRNLDKQWSMVVFLDAGEVQLHRSTWANWNATNPNLNNRYGLAGAGATLVWSPANGRQFTATLANRIGENPGRDLNGRDSDNQSLQPRLWLQANAAF